jgi:hypothetical protein
MIRLFLGGSAKKLNKIKCSVAQKTLENPGLEVIFWTFIREVRGSNLDKDTSYSDWGYFIDFLQLFQTSAVIITLLGHDSFLPKSLQFIIIY